MLRWPKSFAQLAYLALGRCRNECDFQEQCKAQNNTRRFDGVSAKAFQGSRRDSRSLPFGL